MTEIFPISELLCTFYMLFSTGASKGAVDNLTRVMALELGSHNVSVDRVLFHSIKFDSVQREPRPFVENHSCCAVGFKELQSCRCQEQLPWKLSRYLARISPARTRVCNCIYYCEIVGW